jgi:hypothetical protein
LALIFKVFHQALTIGNFQLKSVETPLTSTTFFSTFISIISHGAKVPVFVIDKTTTIQIPHCVDPFHVHSTQLSASSTT